MLEKSQLIENQSKTLPLMKRNQLIRNESTYKSPPCIIHLKFR